MKTRELISSVFWLLAGVLLTGMAATYPLGNFSQPGPGFLPFGLGILLIIFAAVLLLRRVRLMPSTGEKFRMFSRNGKKVVLTVVTLLLSVALFETIGYILTFLFLGLSLTIITRWLSLRTSIIFTVLTVIGIYLVFVWLLKQPLPPGVLGG